MQVCTTDHQTTTQPTKCVLILMIRFCQRSIIRTFSTQIEDVHEDPKVRNGSENKSINSSIKSKNNDTKGNSN
jgi:hypothetical protein